MKQVLKKEYVYHGSGFPVRLLGFPFKKSDGEEMLDVDMEKLDLSIAVAVLRKPAALSGQEVKFLRTLLGMSMQDFGNALGFSSPAIKKWEDHKEKLLHSVPNDFAIRNYVAGRLSLDHQRPIDISVHKSMIEASDFWPTEAVQIPYHLMKSMKFQRQSLSD